MRRKLRKSYSKIAATLITSLLMTSVVPLLGGTAVQNGRLADSDAAGGLLHLTAFADELRPLEAPSWVRWENVNGLYANFAVVEDAKEQYRCQIYKDGVSDPVYTIYNSRNPMEGSMAVWYLWDKIARSGSGTYRFKVQAVGDGRTTADSEWSELSDAFDYVSPKKKLGDVRNLHWSDSEPGVAEWDPPENMDELGEDGWKNLTYFVRLFNEEGQQVWGIYNSYLPCDLSKYMNEETKYTFSVQAQSRDITAFAHGGEVKSKEYVDTSVIVENIQGELGDILLNLDEETASPSDALDAVKSLSLNETAIAVQADEDALGILRDIEDWYLGQTGKEVVPKISEDTGLGESDIKVIGAGLNIASASDAVEIHVTKPNKEKDVDSTLYSKAYQIDIKLEGAINKLLAPVTIIMTIPADIKPECLRILHYHNDGTEEVIWPVIMGDKAKFTLTKFSLFAFVERKEDPQSTDDEPEEDNSGSGSGSGGGGGGGGGSRSTGASAGTTITDSKKGQVNSVTGIITGTGDGYSKWISEAPQAEGQSARWKLQYADGTFAAGSYVTDEQGNPVRDAAGNLIEQPLWELINGAWYAFGVDGYAKSGLIFDPAQNGWFYVDINAGMKTGWQQIDGTWYYFNTSSDGSKGIMYTNRTTPDGYSVGADGRWDGQRNG